MDYSQLSIKSIIFFVIIFGLIIYAYINYENLFVYGPISTIIKVFLVLFAIITISFPNIMDLYDTKRYYKE